MVKKLTKQTAKKKAWKVFSEWVRRKDADGAGYSTCFTCDSKIHWKELNAGHFKHGKLDFDEMNVNPQCVRCNKWLSGKLDIYAFNLIKKYGLDEVAELNLRASREIYEKKSVEDYIKIHDHYKIKLGKLN